MKGYYYVLEKLKSELETIPFVNTITQGSLDDIDNYKSTVFPLSHIIINNVTPENNILRFNVSIIAMDIVDFNKEETTDVFLGNDNEIDVLNTQLTVLIRMYEVLRRGALNDFLEADGFPTMEPFTERFENYLAGWTMTIDLLIPNEMSIC
jgi:hypothetical protein